MSNKPNPKHAQHFEAMARARSTGAKENTPAFARAYESAVVGMNLEAAGGKYSEHQKAMATVKAGGLREGMPGFVAAYERELTAVRREASKASAKPQPITPKQPSKTIAVTAPVQKPNLSAKVAATTSANKFVVPPAGVSAELRRALTVLRAGRTEANVKEYDKAYKTMIDSGANYAIGGAILPGRSNYVALINSIALKNTPVIHAAVDAILNGDMRGRAA